MGQVPPRHTNGMAWKVRRTPCKQWQWVYERHRFSTCFKSLLPRIIRTGSANELIALSVSLTRLKLVISPARTRRSGFKMESLLRRRSIRACLPCKSEAAYTRNISFPFLVWIHTDKSVVALKYPSSPSATPRLSALLLG